MTPAQSSTFAAAVNADPTVSTAVQQHDWFTISNVYNQPTSTLIWRGDITQTQVQGAIVGSEAVKQSAQQLQLLQLSMTAPVINAQDLNIRAQFGAIFPASSAVSTSANLTSIAQRFATKFESLYVSSQVSAVYGQILSPLDVQKAMGF